MSKKIIGVTVGTQLPKPNFKQNDPTKGDYIKNKPDFDGLQKKVSDIDEHVEDLQLKVGDTYVSEQINSAISGNIDTTFTVSGKAADAKAVGDKIAELSTKLDESGGKKTEDGGFVFGNEESSATGESAVAMGYSTIASGTGAVAMGEKTLAVGNGSLAQGSTIFRSGAEYVSYELTIAAVPEMDDYGTLISDTATVVVYYADPEGEYAKIVESLDSLKETNGEVIIIAPQAGSVHETWEPVSRYTGEKQLVATADGRCCLLEDLRYTEAHGTGSFAAGQGAVAYARSSKSLGYRTQTGAPSSPELAAERPEAILANLPFKPSEPIEYWFDDENSSLILLEDGFKVTGFGGEVKYTINKGKLSFNVSGVCGGADVGNSVVVQVICYGQYNNILSDAKKDLGGNDIDTTVTFDIPDTSTSIKIIVGTSQVIPELSITVSNFVYYPADNYGQDTLAIGADTAAIYNQAFAGGWKSIAHSHASLAFGTDAITKGDSAISLGIETEADEISSVALVHRAKARAGRSIAIGLNPSSKEGDPIYETVTNGAMSICAATNSTTNANMSAIIGGYGNTTNTGNFYSAILGGQELTTDRTHQVTIGKFNKADTEALFVIGNGTEKNRANVFTVREDGKLVNGNAMLALDEVYRTIAAYPRYVTKTIAKIGTAGNFPVLIYNSTESIAGRKFQIVFDSIENEQAYSGLNLSVTAYTDSSCTTKVGANIDPTGCYITVPKDRTNAKTLRIILPKGIFLKNNAFDTSIKVAICEVTEHNFLMNRKLREQLLAGNLYSLEEFDKVENTYVTIPHSHWYGKNCVAFGTSVTNKLISNKPLIGRYIDHLTWYFGWNLSNYGVGSKGVTTDDAGTLVEIEKFVKTEEAKTTDLIIIEVGANDVGTVWNGRGGTVTDLYIPGDDTSNNTFCGRLNYCLKLLLENTRAQIVVFSSPYSQSEKDAADTYTWDPYELTKQIYKTNNLTEECCKFNNVPYLVLQTGLGFRRLNSDTSNLYVREDISGGPDIHPAELGAQILAESMVDRIRQIPLFPKA